MAKEGEKDATAARKVMVIADATRESAAALQYTLTNAILDNDSLILLHVMNNNHGRKNPFPFFKKPGPNNSVASPTENNERCNSGSGSSGGTGSNRSVSLDLSFLEEMKSACKKVVPQIEVAIEVVGMDGKDKAHVILAQCSEHGIDLLIIGQRRTLSSAILGKQMKNTPLRVDTADYLIQNSKCTCVAVHKKGQNAGYLLNTKTQKDFWLLA